MNKKLRDSILRVREIINNAKVPTENRYIRIKGMKWCTKCEQFVAQNTPNHTECLKEEKP